MNMIRGHRLSLTFSISSEQCFYLFLTLLSCYIFLHKTTQTIPQTVSWTWSELSSSLCSRLCFKSEMQQHLPTSGSDSTFIFDSLPFSMLGSGTRSSSLRTVRHRDWIPLTDVFGMANPVGEITSTPEVSLPLIPSLVFRGRITVCFYLQNRSVAWDLTAGGV